MKRGREEKNSPETLPSLTRRLQDGVIYIPLDLTVEILKKLPTKTLMRFQCVSKVWSSLISSRRDLIDSILTRSLNQPPRDAHIISDNSRNKSIIALTSTSMPLNTDEGLELLPGQYHQYVRGLVLCRTRSPYVLAVYNPTTRQSFELPELKSDGISDFFFGYDPCKNQYKVLSIRGDRRGHVFTLGDPTAKQWRNIGHVIRPGLKLLRGVVCINGTIYYRDATSEYGSKYYPSPENIELMGFDVSSEKFHHVEASKLLMHLHRDSTLINYQEKLGLISCEMRDLEIWVLETQGWSKFFVCDMCGIRNWNISGTTRGGEIVFVEKEYSSFRMLRVYYYDLKRNSMRHVDLEREKGSLKRHSATILTVPDHVDNIMGLHCKIEY